MSDTYFFGRNQLLLEKMDSFLTNMNLKAKFCEFGNLQDGLVKDRVVCGIQNEDI